MNHLLSFILVTTIFSGFFAGVAKSLNTKEKIYSSDNLLDFLLNGISENKYK